MVQAVPRNEDEYESSGEQAASGEPRVQVEPRSARVRPGETVRLVCSVAGSNSAEHRFTWSKQGGYLPGGSDGENSDVLTLFNPQEQDSGVYVCTAENTATGSRSEGTSRVQVEGASGGSDGGDNGEEPNQAGEPLKVDVQPKEATLVQGREGEFVCNVQGGGANRVITWKRTGSEGGLDAERHRVQDNRLIVSNAQSSDRGYFECEVQSGNEMVRDYARVEVESREAPKIEIYPSEEQVELDVGGTVYAQCRVVAGIPAPTVEWRRVDRRPLGSRAVVSQEGSLLQITEATRDEMTAYECVAANAEGEASLKLTVVPRSGSAEETHPQPPPRRPEEDEREPPRPSDDEEKPPNVNILTPVVQVPEGDTVTLQCQTQSAPPFRIDWAAPNGDYLESSQDGTYSKPNARAADSGTYTCTVTNRYGNTAASASVTVGDGAPSSGGNTGGQPQPSGERLSVQVTPKSRTVTAGQQAEFTCDARTSSGEPIIRWSRAGGLPLPEYHQTRGNQLILYNIESEHAGRYQCTAQSADGSIEFDAAYLQVGV